MLMGMSGAGRFQESQPMVFLNACEIGRPEPALVGVEGFAKSFIALGARCVIAPLWSVKDSIAHQVATEFYQRMSQEPGLPLAAILRDIRRKAYEEDGGEDTYAAYTFYGDPLAAKASA
jgi:CHAT domain-containing protein